MHGMQKGGKYVIINLIKMSAADWSNSEKCQKDGPKIIFSVIFFDIIDPRALFVSLPSFVAMGNGELVLMKFTGRFLCRRHIGLEI